MFVDLSKAVDAISHAELLRKIPFYEIHGKLNWRGSLHTLFVDHRLFSICVIRSSTSFYRCPLAGEYFRACFIHNSFQCTHSVAVFQGKQFLPYMPMHYYIHTLLYALLSHKMHGMGCNQCFCVPYCLVSNQDGLVTSWFIMVMIGPNILNRIQLYLKT